MLFSTTEVVLFWKLGKNEVYNHGVNLWYVAVLPPSSQRVFLKVPQNG
jgi:hypothetical protein